MQFTALGRLTGLFSMALLTTGLIFLNLPAVIASATVFLFLLVEAASFRREIYIARRSISILTEPKVTEVMMERMAQTKTIIRNSTPLDFRIGKLDRVHPPEIQVIMSASSGLLAAREEQEVNVFMMSETPGKYDTQGTKLTLIAPRGLFVQSLTFEDTVSVITYPIAQAVNTLSNVTALSELSTDPVKRGIGTDLAGLRPSTFLDDYHRIDWKATARTGKLFSRDFHAENEPTIILLIDVVSFRCQLAGRHRKEILTQFADLLEDPFVSMCPLGMVMYDEQKVIGRINPQVGPKGRRLLLDTLLHELGGTSDAPEVSSDPSRPYVELIKEREALVRDQSLLGKTSPTGERLASLTERILPYYNRAISTHHDRVRSQGGFKAFEVLATLTEAALVVCLTRQESTKSGLLEGARRATTLNHHVIIALIEDPQGARVAEPHPELIDLGISTVTTTPGQLWRSINDELRTTKRSRTLPSIISK